MSQGVLNASGGFPPLYYQLVRSGKLRSSITPQSCCVVAPQQPFGRARCVRLQRLFFYPKIDYSETPANLCQGTQRHIPGGSDFRSAMSTTNPACVVVTANSARTDSCLQLCSSCFYCSSCRVAVSPRQLYCLRHTAVAVLSPHRSMLVWAERCLLSLITRIGLTNEFSEHIDSVSTRFWR